MVSSHSHPDESNVGNDVDTPAADTPTPAGSDVERMMPLVYEELRRIARRQLRHEGIGHTLNTTARLVDVCRDRGEAVIAS